MRRARLQRGVRHDGGTDGGTDAGQTWPSGETGQTLITMPDRPAAGGLHRRAGHQPRRGAALRPRPRALLAGRHRRLHRPQQGDRLQPGRRADRPPAGPGDRPDREPRSAGPATMLVLDGAPYAAIGWRSTPTTSPPSPSTWPASGCCPGGGPSPARPSRRPGRRRDRRAGPPGGRPDGQDGRQVLGLTVGVPGLVDAAGVVRLAPNLGWHDVALRDDLLSALRDPASRSRWRTTPTWRSWPSTATAPHAGVAEPGLPHRRGRHRRRHHRRRPAAARRRAATPARSATCRSTRRRRSAAAGGAAAWRRSPGSAAVLEHASPSLGGGRVWSSTRWSGGPARATPARSAALGGVGRDLGYGVALLANLLNPEVVVLGGYFVPLAPGCCPRPRPSCGERRSRRRPAAAGSSSPPSGTARPRSAARPACSTPWTPDKLPATL